MKQFSILNNEQIGVHTSKWRTENSDNKWVSMGFFVVRIICHNYYSMVLVLSYFNANQLLL